MRFVKTLAALLIVSPVVAYAAASTQVTLSSAAMARAGMTVATLQTVRMAPSVTAVGVVLDPAALIRLSGQIAALDAQIAGDKAKDILEQQQMAQASALYKHGEVVSLADFQKAAQDLAASGSALAVARAKRKSLDQQIAASWGPSVAAIVRSDGEPLPQLAAGKAMLVALSLPPGVALPEPPHEITAEARGIRFTARLIAPVPRMFDGFPGQAILYQAAVHAGIPIGASVTASLPTAAERAGVLVPWSAVLWRGGKAVVFRAVDERNRFEPVSITTDLPTDRGYFVTAALARGDRIVVHGAALLLGGPAKLSTGGENDEDD